MNEAAASLEAAGDRASLATVWTSLGRLQRAQGSYDEAIAYYRKGLNIQQDLGDKIGVIQSLNSIAIAYDEGGHSRESMEQYERALALAKETGSPRVIAFMTGNMGGAVLQKGNYPRAIELLEECLRLDPSSSHVALRYKQLSEAYRGAQQYERALECANESVNLLRKADSPDTLFLAFEARADVYEDLKRYPQALADTQEAIHAVEQIRSKLVPADYLKQGYAARTQDLFALGHPDSRTTGATPGSDAHGGGSARPRFLDLLATRSNATKRFAGFGLCGFDPRRQAICLRKARHLEQLSRRVASNSPPAAPLPCSSLLRVARRRFPVPFPLRRPRSMTLFPRRNDWTPRSSAIGCCRMPLLFGRSGPMGMCVAERIAVTSEKLSGLIRSASYGEEEPGAGPATIRGEGKDTHRRRHAVRHTWSSGAAFARRRGNSPGWQSRAILARTL